MISSCLDNAKAKPARPGRFFYVRRSVFWWVWGGFLAEVGWIFCRGGVIDPESQFFAIQVYFS